MKTNANTKILKSIFMTGIKCIGMISTQCFKESNLARLAKNTSDFDTNVYSICEDIVSDYDDPRKSMMKLLGIVFMAGLETYIWIIKNNFIKSV